VEIVRYVFTSIISPIFILWDIVQYGLPWKWYVLRQFFGWTNNLTREILRFDIILEIVHSDKFFLWFNWIPRPFLHTNPRISRFCQIWEWYVLKCRPTSYTVSKVFERTTEVKKVYHTLLPITVIKIQFFTNAVYSLFIVYTL